MSFSLCQTSVGNTGSIQCDIAPGIPVLFMIWNGQKAVSEIIGDAFQTFLEASSKKSKADSDKVFVFPIIQDVADASEANTTGSLNQGLTVVLREGKPAYTFKSQVGISLSKQLRKFNNQNVKVLVLDNHNRVWGVQAGETFRGAQANVFTTSPKLATGQAVEEGIATITLSFLIASEMNDDAAFGEIVSSSDIKGLLDAKLTNPIAHVSNAYKIAVTIPTSKVGSSIDVLSQFGPQLAASALWVAKTGPNFATTLPITTVAYDPATSTETVTFDTTAFAALATGAKIQLNLAAPATLDDADVTELEGIEVILTK